MDTNKTAAIENYGIRFGFNKNHFRNTYYKFAGSKQWLSGKFAERDLEAIIEKLAAFPEARKLAKDDLNNAQRLKINL